MSDSNKSFTYSKIRKLQTSLNSVGQSLIDDSVFFKIEVLQVNAVAKGILVTERNDVGSDKIKTRSDGELEDVLGGLEGTREAGQQYLLRRVDVQVEAARSRLLVVLDVVAEEVGRNHRDLNVLVEVESLVTFEVNVGGEHGNTSVVPHFFGSMDTIFGLDLETEGDMTRRHVRGLVVVLESNGLLVVTGIEFGSVDGNVGRIKYRENNLKLTTEKLRLRDGYSSEVNSEIEGSSGFDSLLRVELVRRRYSLGINGDVKADRLPLSRGKAEFIESRDSPGQGEGQSQFTKLTSGIVVVLSFVKLRLGVVGDTLGLGFFALLDYNVTGGGRMGETISSTEEDVGAEESSLDNSVSNDFELVVAYNIRRRDLESLLEDGGSGQSRVSVSSGRQRRGKGVEESVQPIEVQDSAANLVLSGEKEDSMDGIVSIASVDLSLVFIRVETSNLKN